jgi:ferric-dicitrate binding protein FerR (iron transport regulator)
MKKEDFHDLVDKYLTGKASTAEKRLLEEYYSRLSSGINLLPEEEEEKLRKQMLEEILERSGIRKPKVVFLRRSWWKYAAAAIIVLSAGAWLLTSLRTEKKESVRKAPLIADIAPPSGTRTTLTLGNGQQIILDSVKNGVLAVQGNANILKSDNNQLSYKSLTERPGELVFNTLSTAKGGQTMLVLADGTKVWLNSLSSLKFPTAFSGNERRVELTGEGYFEVAKNAGMPFHVLVNQEDVRVLGTHFNVNAYADESLTKTTLFEGSVKITRNNEETLLKPRQQVIIDNGSGAVKLINDADLDEALAWKNGLFEFSGVGIKSIMRQIGRWYDVEVSYDGNIPADLFSGIVNRSSNLSQVLKVMQQANVHFTIEGNKIIVRP